MQRIAKVVRDKHSTKTSLGTKQIALLVIFAALYTILRFIPFGVLIGGAGGPLYFSDFLAPILGILLGPYLGALSVVIGNFGAIGLGSPIRFVRLPYLDFLPDFVAAVSLGFLMRRKWLPIALNASLLAAFLVNPLTSIFVAIPGTSTLIPFAWMDIAAFVILLTPLAGKAVKWVEKATKTEQIAAGFAILSFIGTMLQHLTGNILFEVAYGQINPPIIPAAAWPTEWALVVLTYPVQRAILIISAVIVGTPIALVVNKNSPFKNKKQEQTNTETS